MLNVFIAKLRNKVINIYKIIAECDQMIKYTFEKIAKTK